MRITKTEAGILATIALASIFGAYALGISAGLDGVCVAPDTLSMPPAGDVLEDKRRVEAILTLEGFNVRGFAEREDLPAIAVPANIPERCHPMTRAAALTRQALQVYGITNEIAIEHNGDTQLAQAFEGETARAMAAVFDDADQTKCLATMGAR